MRQQEREALRLYLIAAGRLMLVRYKKKMPAKKRIALETVIADLEKPSFNQRPT